MSEFKPNMEPDINELFKPYERIIKVISLVFLLTLSSILIFSCSSSKKINTSSEKTTATSIIDVDSLVTKKVDSTSRHYEEKIKTLDNIIEFGENCNDDVLAEVIDSLQSQLFDSAVNLDALRRAIYLLQSEKLKQPGKIVYRPDGSFEATGLKYANMKLFESQKQIDDLKMMVEEMTNLKIKAEEELKVEKANKQVDKKTKFFTQWWLWIIIAVVFFVIGFRVCWKYKDGIKKELKDETNFL